MFPIRFAHRTSLASAVSVLWLSLFNSAAAAQQNSADFSVLSEPDLHIGVLDGDPEYQFSRLIQVVMLDNGTIVTADAGTRELKGYDANGEHVFTSGGEGGGPGEFRNIELLARLPGDTLLVYDDRLNRVSIFDSRGMYARSFRIMTTEDSGPWIRGVFRSGHMLAQVRRGFGIGTFSDGVAELNRTFLVHDPDGAVVDTLGDLRVGRMFVQNYENRSGYHSIPFDSHLVLTVAGDLIYHGYSDEYAVHVLERNGKPVCTATSNAARSPVTDDDVHAYFENAYANEPADVRQRARQVYDRMPIPSQMPAFSKILVDPAGNIWVQDHMWPWREPRLWTVFDSNCQELGRVETPARLQVTQIGNDHIIGIWRDEFDVNYVRRHRLVR